MPEWIVSASVGAGLILCGLLMMRAHRKEWLLHKARLERTGAEPDSDHAATDDETENVSAAGVHYRARYRRRMQTSALLILIGILIPLGDGVIPWAHFKQAVGERRTIIAFCLYWIGVVLLAGWALLLAFGDIFSTVTHARGELARIRVRQAQLERELAQHRRTDQPPSVSEIKD